MLLVLILLAILIFIVFTIFILVGSTVKINVRYLNIANVKDNFVKTKLGMDYNINFGIYLFGKIKIVGFNLIKEKHGKRKVSKFFKFLKLNNNNVKSVVKERVKIREIIKATKILNPKAEKIKLNIVLDTEDVIMTTAFISISSSIIGVVFANLIEKFSEKKHAYNVQGLYKNKNIIKINLNCIICIKMVHIIHIIYIVLKEKERFKNGRTSNTRNDDNSNGKHKRYGRCEHNYR